MVAYFVRRLLGGLIELLLAWLAIYTIVIHAPGGYADAKRSMDYAFAHSRECMGCTFYYHFVVRMYGLDKPWPLDYVHWLFSTDRTNMLNPSGLLVQNGIDIGMGNLRLQGSGVLTGDLGESVTLARGFPVAAMLGPKLGMSLVLLWEVLLSAMLIAGLQRRGRSKVWQASSRRALEATDSHLKKGMMAW